MFAPKTQPRQPLSALLGRIIVRLWPEETKQWGLAFAAELPEISTPRASFQWVMGGLMLLTREWWRSFFKGFARPIGVPAGSPLENFVKNSSRVPRTPRIVTALLLLASTAILLHPDVRSCVRLSMRSISTGSDDGNSVNWRPSRWDSVKRLRKEAQTNRDPKLLALLSLLSTDAKERLELSDAAIRKDPSLTWLDFEQIRSEQHVPDGLPQGRMQRLQMWDPENAVLRELTARDAAYRSGTEWGSVSWPKFPYSGKGGLLHAEESPSPDAQWLSAMDAVFVAPKYGAYGTQEFDLIRDVTQRYGIHDPDISLYILAAHHLPNLLNLRSYNNWLLNQSEKKEHAGDRIGALADARKALSFSQRMWLGGRTSAIEALIADSLGIKAGERLQALLQEQGQTNEASLVAFQLAEWNADIDRVRFSRGISRAGPQAAEWAGTTILLATIIILFTGFVSCISLLVLWLKRTAVDAHSRVLACLSWALDAAPIVLLGACSVVYLAYQPFARTYSAYFSARQPISDFQGLFDAGSVTHVLATPITQMMDPVLLWTVTTVGLSLLAALLVFRMLLRHLRHI